jgi:hypothetical protein
LLIATMTLRVLHARQVLDRARDADGDVEIGRHDLAGLAHLPVVRRKARIDRGARGAHGGAQLVGQPSISAKSSSEPTPRPPETTTPAEVSSGRSLSATLSSTHSDRPGCRRPRRWSRPGPSPPVPAASKVEVRIETTFLASLDFTVWIALPA